MRGKLTHNKLVFLILIIILVMGLEVYAQVSSSVDVQNRENSQRCSITGVRTNTGLIDLLGSSQFFLGCELIHYGK